MVHFMKKTTLYVLGAFLAGHMFATFCFTREMYVTPSGRHVFKYKIFPFVKEEVLPRQAFAAQFPNAESVDDTHYYINKRSMFSFADPSRDPQTLGYWLGRAQIRIVRACDNMDLSQHERERIAREYSTLYTTGGVPRVADYAGRLFNSSILTNYVRGREDGLLKQTGSRVVERDD